ncbi:Transposase, IS5 family [Halanaeroarchaeum sp. HSR-CO]|nr:Transposase, IS5 family [Halanaeroarchaeum sp. HSR-CO]
MYNQRAMTKIVNSSIKRSILDSVSARACYRQFREIILAASVHNVKRAVKP